MAKRATIADLAEAAGVSVATVDRVLNGRLPVRADTARRVAEAAAAVGFHAANLINQRLRQDEPEWRLGFLLQKPDQLFYQQFAAELRTAAENALGMRVTPVIEFSSSPAVDHVADEMKVLAGKVDAVAVVSPDHPALETAIEALRLRGKPVFSLLSDFAPGARASYVGVDNRKVGRTAAWMIAKCARRPGKVALFVGSHGFHGHELREIGLRSFFREHAPHFSVMETFVNHETVDLTRDTMLDLLANEPDFVGCYVGGGGSEGAIAALREATPAQMPILICNEDTILTRQALTDGIAALSIVTPIVQLSRELIGLMGAALAEGETNVNAQSFLPFGLLLPESF